MKKFITTVVVIAFVLSFTACSNKDTTETIVSESTEIEETTTETEETEESEETEETEAEDIEAEETTSATTAEETTGDATATPTPTVASTTTQTTAQATAAATTAQTTATPAATQATQPTATRTPTPRPTTAPAPATPTPVPQPSTVTATCPQCGDTYQVPSNVYTGNDTIYPQYHAQCSRERVWATIQNHETFEDLCTIYGWRYLDGHETWDNGVDPDTLCERYWDNEGISTCYFGN